MKNELNTTPLSINGQGLQATTSDWKLQFRQNAVDLNPSMSGHSADMPHWMMGVPAMAGLIRLIQSEMADLNQAAATHGYPPLHNDVGSVLDILGVSLVAKPVGMMAELRFQVRFLGAFTKLIWALNVMRYSLATSVHSPSTIKTDAG